MFNFMYYNSYVILSSSQFVSNSSESQFELSIVSVSRKPECPILEFELLSRFFVNLLLEILQGIVIPCFYL
jgi:hypothetical protein